MLWKHSDDMYTLRSSKGLWFTIAVYKGSRPQSISTTRIMASDDYIPSGGVLLPTIPVFLKYTVYGLQGIEQ